MAETVRSVDRALDIIEQLSSNGPLGPSRLAELTGMDKSTVFRLLATLQQRGYVDRRENGIYTLGAKLISVVSSHMSSLELQTEARPFLSDLSTDLGLTTHMGLLVGAEVVYIELLDKIPTPQIYSQIGRHVPAYCSSLGKCLLARLSGDDLEEVMHRQEFKRFTQNTISNLIELKEHLRIVRKQGWALDDEESEYDHICVGAPIYDYRGEIIAAVSASGTTSMIPRDYLPVVVEAVKKTAKDISQHMGYLG